MLCKNGIARWPMLHKYGISRWHMLHKHRIWRSLAFGTVSRIASFVALPSGPGLIMTQNERGGQPRPFKASSWKAR